MVLFLGIMICLPVLLLYGEITTEMLLLCGVVMFAAAAFEVVNKKPERKKKAFRTLN